MIVAIAVKLRVDCKECGAGIAVNRFGHSVRCGHCSGGRALQWKSLLADALGRVDHVAEGTHDKAGGANYRWQHADFWKRAAVCPGCKRALAKDEIEPALESGSLVCACGASTRIRRPPKDLLAIDGRIRALFGEADPRQLAQPAAVPHSITAQCTTCGAALPLGKERSVQCTYCSTDNLLPDAIWNRLQPKTDAPTLWYLLLEIGGAG